MKRATAGIVISGYPPNEQMSHFWMINAARDGAVLSDAAADPRTDGDIDEFSLKRRASVKLSQGRSIHVRIDLIRHV